MPRYSVSSHLVTKLDEIETQWLDLQSRADCSYFQSWGWIGTWMEQIGLNMKPVIVEVHSDQHLIGLGLFVIKNIKRRKIIRSSAYFLNEYPFDGKNMVIEYNGLLAEKGSEQIVYKEAVHYLFQQFKDIDEFHFGALADGINLECLKRSRNDKVQFIVNEISPAWKVDLSAFSAGLDGYLTTLSKNRRGQIRRSVKLYEKQGVLQLEEARTTEEAFVYFKELEALHTKRWQAKGKRGVFANPVWVNFHQSLIKSRFDSGEVQLLRVSHSQSVIGCLYNFIWNGAVYVLQTGFKTSNDPRLMPGYVTHSLAVVYNKNKGKAVYDLMHGDSLYKRILCNQSQNLNWVVMQRPRFKFALEMWATCLVRKYRKALK